VKSVKEKIAIACIGPITADTAREQGFDVDIIPNEYTLEALTEAIIHYFKVS
jgi:uroporphyrinogen III methyltransferase/synthase